MLGENKVQEAQRKSQALIDLADLRWSVIGHLQTNKAKLVARFASEFQALDSLRVAEALDRRLQQEGRALDVLVQVNTSDEASKYGLAPDAAANFVRELPAFSSLRVKGLMTLAVFSSNPAQVQPCFRRLRRLPADHIARQSDAGGVPLWRRSDVQLSPGPASTASIELVDEELLLPVALLERNAQRS